MSTIRGQEYDGLVAVVTGGSDGIGLAVGLELAARGARVASLDLAVDDLPEEITGFRCDVTDRASVQAAVAQVVDRLGGIDVLVNNAGVSAVGTVEELGDEDWHRVLDVNVVGMARSSAAALPHLRASRHPAIVNMCSIGALNGLPQRVAYNASKGAVLALTYAMATDYVGEGIRVNCVSPGTVHTGFVDRMLARFPDPEREKAALDARQATGRMVTPEEVADAVAYLASPRSGSTTGTALDVDGGITHLRPRPVQQTD
ncbi:SDR family NAD(P)-dependent oxidoreductase [Nocardioides sp. BP30]|uniref:SDR family NAD(P)-dependent oxidoreductase n=1 Tax=Nocardioides sp. BP30 TaxID=3036374 RepID=UPI00246936F6|nr:SDR family oxidoreductase [Nocardioides sp. BP30]WGL50553.1 SDR family NAD(P)-dependent oxidoreductase [Nocardioides sp. BP30]